MDNLTNTLIMMGFGLFLLFLAWWQYHTVKTGSSVLSSKPLKKINIEDNPTAVKIRVFLTLVLTLILIVLSIISATRLF